MPLGECRLPRYLLAILLPLIIVAAGCATYDERVAPLPLPSARNGAVDVDGAQILARAFIDPSAAERAFGFDIRGAGLLPVQIVVDNQSGQTMAVQPQQTLLIDKQDMAWPLLSAKRAQERVQATVEQGESIKAGTKASLLTGLAGAVAGAAIGIVTGGNLLFSTGKGAAAGAAIGALGGGARRYSDLGREVHRDLEQESLGNRVIGKGELVHGYLFFPGKGEASTARSLRLGLRIGQTTRIITIPITAVGTG